MTANAATPSNGSCFFVLSCARSGSTSLAVILDEAANGRCVSEPAPNLNRETREMMDGRRTDPAAVVTELIVPRVRAALQDVDVYGEKNVTYGPFITALHELLRCGFVLNHRDGRDVVRSLMDWHELKFGTIYRECLDPGDLAPQAIAAAAALPVHQDTSDYARPRPARRHPLHAEWETLSREEMCAYYWSTINDLYVTELAKLPEDAWTAIDYTRPAPDDVLRVAEFFGLQGLQPDRVDRMLAAAINSLQDRDNLENRYPDWRNWNGGQRRRFDRVAGDTMRALGHYGPAGTEWRPPGYGAFWRRQGGDQAWYARAHDGREMHQDLVAWVQSRDSAGDIIESIADLGCGLGVGYCDDFANKRYVGIDISEGNVCWCRRHRDNPRHEYHCRDFVAEPLAEPVDLVFSSGTLDNVYDVDGCLRSMVRSTRKWLQATFYRGWFPELTEHRYSWNEEHKCFYADVSPARIRETLQALGCRDIRVEPVPTGREDVPYGTRVTARVRE